MANQTISGLSTISSPSSAALAWIYDPNASPQDRSFSLANLQRQRKIVSTSGALGVIAPTVDTTYIFTDASTATLPASPIAGQQLTFKAKTTATSTISANSGQTIGTTSSTAFILYAQEDYVTLEWDGTSIWYVVATNGPLLVSAQTTYMTMITTNAWTACGVGLTLGSLAPGVYDFEGDCDLVLTNTLSASCSLAIGKIQVPISDYCTFSNPAAQSMSCGARMGIKGYVLNAASVIQIIYNSNNASNALASGTLGSITARRIG